MTKNAMISVKDAASLLNLDERSVRERLANGSLKGEKLSHGQRDKWYVYATAIESELRHKQRTQSAAELLGNLQLEEKTRNTGSQYENRTINFEPSDVETVDAEISSSSGDSDERNKWRSVQLEHLEVIAEKLMKPLTERIEAQAMALSERDRIIEEKDRQLRLLPDLQQQAEEERRAAELRTLEVEALKKQIEALEQKQAAAVEQEEQAWKQQIAALKEKQAIAIEQERRAVDEANLEVERLKSEKEAASKVIQEQLAALTAQLQELKQSKMSWWQKWFAPGE